MSKYQLVVAALLLTQLPAVAVAAEYPEHKSKNAQKVLDVLNSVGVNNQQIQEFVSEVDTHVKDGYYQLAERQVPGGHVTLRFELGSSLSPRKLELMYAPTDSHIQCIGAPDHVLVNYHLNF